MGSCIVYKNELILNDGTDISHVTKLLNENYIRKTDEYNLYNIIFVTYNNSIRIFIFTLKFYF